MILFIKNNIIFVMIVNKKDIIYLYKHVNIIIKYFNDNKLIISYIIKYKIILYIKFWGKRYFYIIKIIIKKYFIFFINKNYINNISTIIINLFIIIYLNSI